MCFLKDKRICKINLKLNKCVRRIYVYFVRNLDDFKGMQHMLTEFLFNQVFTVSIADFNRFF